MFQMKAFAKINWFLSVMGKRADGYHDISSLMQCVDLCDTLLFENSDALEILSDIPDLPPEKNLVFMAAMLMRDVSGGRRGAKIALTKHIPLAGGMGGGSSDAAAPLVGLNRL